MSDEAVIPIALPPWCDRSSQQFELRHEGGTKRVLMRRYADADGKTHDGSFAVWEDIAVFDSYNDADSVLRLLRKAQARQA